VPGNTQRGRVMGGGGGGRAQATKGGGQTPDTPAARQKNGEHAPGLGRVYAAHLGEHPVLGRVQALHVLLGATGHFGLLKKEDTKKKGCGGELRFEKATTARAKARGGNQSL
jgi:hypothetical protein